MPPEKVEEREEEDPDDVDEVPVEARPGRRACCTRGVNSPCRAFDDQPGEQADADDHVEGVQPGHAEVEREEELALAAASARPARRSAAPGTSWCSNFCCVLDELDAEEDATRAGSSRAGTR